MAYRRKTFRRKRAYRTRRKRTRTRKSRAPVVAIGGQIQHTFPRMMKFTHRYTDMLVLTGVAGATGSYTFSANGLYDPNITGTGRQPLCFDQMSALYDHYCVIGSKINIRVCATSTLIPAQYFGVYINDDTGTTPGSAAGYIANGRAFRLLPPGGVNTTSMKASWSAKKVFGKSALANVDLQGTAATNPTEQSYYTLFVGTVDQSSNASVSVIVDIEYIAIWKETKDLDLS